MDLSEYLSAIPDNIQISDNYTSTVNTIKEPEETQIIKEIKESVSIFNKNAYVICEKKSFRSDALFTLLSEHFNAKISYVADAKLPEFIAPLCFVIDITSFFLTDKMAQKIGFYIQDIAADNNIPIFLIGETEDLRGMKRFLNYDTLSITVFERPIDAKECVYEIKSMLMSATTKKKRKHAIIVDDSSTYLKLMRRILENNFRITTASSALDCIKILSIMLPKTPDIMVIDNKMPVCDGIRLIEMLRNDPAFSNIPMVMCSASADTDTLIQAMPAVDGYILKSNPLTGLDVFLAEVIEKKKKEHKSKEKKENVKSKEKKRK